MIAIIALAMVFEQADNYNFSFVAPTLVKYWGLTVQQIGNINSLYAVGLLIGTFIAGFCSDRFGRKKTLLVASFGFSIFTLLNGMAPNPTVFALMRVLTGVGIAAVLIVAPPYMVEMLPSENRGRAFGLASGFGFIGIPAIAILCNIFIPMGQDHWRLIYVFGAVGLFVVIFGFKWLHESPRWLVSKGKVHEAEQVTEKIVGPDYKSDLSQVVIHEEKIPIRVVLAEMFSKKYIKNTVVLLSIFCLAYPAGLVFVNFASTLLVDRGFSVAQGLKLTSLMSFGMIAGPFLASVIAEWGGRKIPMVVTSLVLGGMCLVYAFLKDYTAICVAAIILAMLGQTIAVLANAYGSELFPTRIRNAAIGTAMSIGRVFIIFTMAFFPVIYKHFGFVGVYVFLFGVYCIPALLIGLFGIRTSGVSLEALTEKTEDVA